MGIITGLVVVGLGVFAAFGVRIVDQIELGLVETFGKYSRTVTPGLNWIIPLIQDIKKVNMTERMIDIPKQTVITNDKLNTNVDGIIYYQINDAVASEYNVENHRVQLSSLARTTLRAVMGKMTLTESNENRDEINQRIEDILTKETKTYGVNVLRVEIQSIEPPEDVQVAMNQVVKAEQEKIAANDIATALETRADGERRAEIKKAEGIKQGSILSAEGKSQAIELEANAKANAIRLVNLSAAKYFTGNAQLLKRIEATEASLKNNSKIVVDSKSELVNVIGNMSGVPLVTRKKKK